MGGSGGPFGKWITMGPERHAGNREKKGKDEEVGRPVRLAPPSPRYQPTPLLLFVSCCLFFLLEVTRRSKVKELNAVAKPAAPQSPCAVAARETRAMWPGNPHVPHDAWIPPTHSNGDRIASHRCEDDDYDDYKDAGSRIIDEPHMTLGCSSIQVQTPLPQYFSPNK